MWISCVPRLILALAVISFGSVGFVYVLEPALIGRLGVEVTNPGGFTSIRVGIGGLHLGAAMIALYCVYSRARVLAGLVIVSTIAGVVVAVRFGGLIIQGFDEQVVGLMMPEALALLIYAGGSLLEIRLQGAVAREST